MLHDSNVTEYSLASGALIAINQHAGLIITADAGTLWITEPGEGDIVLQPGEQYHSTSHGKLVIEALSTARLHFRASDTQHAYGAAKGEAVHQATPRSIAQQTNSSHVRGDSNLCSAH
ncbi:MAG: DUF2917 domain-containing protein [Burkholderiales bacterium]|nr:DUF2917 domain-containing protein [Burkholderiales bacterium]